MNNGTFSFPVGSTHIGYSVVGNGPPVLIAPVSWGIDGHRWKSLDALAKQCTVIRLDPRGTGMSGDVHDKIEYGIPTLVADIEQLRIHLGIEQWNMMGQSAGGWTALEYVLAHQARVQKLMIVCSAPTGKFHTGTFRDPAHPFYQEFTRISHSVRSLPAGERVKKFNRAMYQLDVQSDEAKTLIDDIFAHAEFNAQRNQYFVMNELNRYNVTEQLHTITVPSLIVGGRHDAHVSPVWSTMMADNIPGAQLVMMDDSGHFPWLDEPERFFMVLNKFLLSI